MPIEHDKETPGESIRVSIQKSKSPFTYSRILEKLRAWGIKREKVRVEQSAWSSYGSRGWKGVLCREVYERWSGVRRGYAEVG